MSLLSKIKNKLKSKIRLSNKENTVEFSAKYCQLYRIKVCGKNNVIKMGRNFRCKNLKINIKGENNKIIIEDDFNANIFCIEIAGCNNNILIKNNVMIVDELTIYNHCNTQNAKIEIGAHTSFFKTSLYNYDNDSSIIIGDDCMFAYNTLVYNTDGHAVMQDGKVINRAKECKIEDHVWLGMDSCVLKNSLIPSGCIVGKSAIVSKQFNERNVVIAGNPGKIVKKDISWVRSSVNDLM